jgi:hypothetical protein
MTETLFHSIDGNQRDGDPGGRTRAVFGLVKGRERARGVFLHAIGYFGASHHPFGPP